MLPFRYIESKSDRIGAEVNFLPPFLMDSDDPSMEVLARTESGNNHELVYLGEHLAELGWIKGGQRLSSVNAGSREFPCWITPKGYARLDELKRTRVASEQAFVAMWFDKAMNDAYEKGIAAGIKDAGYKPVRIDKQQYNGKVDDEIIAEIRRSRFLVADFTQGESGARGGVYYEAGFAHGLNIPVIFTCRKDVLKKVHFDTRQYNHIDWETAEELRDRVSKRISATIGDGPLKKK